MKSPAILLALALCAPAVAEETTPATAPMGPPAYILLPFGLPNYDFDKKLVNQTPATPERGIELDHYEGGLRYIRELNVNAMGGLMALIPWKLLYKLAPSAIPAVGVFPTTSGMLTSDRGVSSPDEAKQLPEPRIPLRAEALDSWKIHDSMSLQVSGGVVFQVSATISTALSAGPIFVATGSWTSYVEKIGEHEAYLKFTREKLRALDVSSGATLLTVDLTTFKDSDETFSFRFDLTNADAVEAYENAFHGNLLPAQQLASAGGKAVRLEVSAWSKKIGHMREISIKIPLLLSASAGSGRIEGSDETLSHLDGTRSESHFGIYNRELKLRHFHTHRARTDTFFASIMSNGPQDGPLTESRIGSYSLTYEDDHATDGELSSQVARMVRYTGIHELDDISFDHAGKLGYANVKLELAFSPAATARLTAAADKAGLEKELVESAKSLVDAYLAGKTDPDRLCDRETGPKGLDLAACRDDLYQQATNAALDGTSALGRMKKASSDAAQFSRRYAELGKAMLENRFGLKAVLKLADPANVEVTFSAQGERISKLERKLSF